MHSYNPHALSLSDLLVSGLLAAAITLMGILAFEQDGRSAHPGLAVADETGLLSASGHLWETYPWLQPPMENLARLWAAGRHETLSGTESQETPPAETKPLYDLIAEHYPMGMERARQFAGWIEGAADTYEVPAELLAAVIAVESSFRVDVRSSVGAVGPAQLRPEYWSELGYNLNDPGENIRAGARVLSNYYRLCESDWDCALRAYNVGITRVMNGGGGAAGERYVSRISSAPFVAEGGGW